MSTGTSCIVEQFGLAMMPSCQARSSGLTWLTTSGTAGSIRHAVELSMTVAPRLAASGASALDVSPPALNSAMSTPSNASGVASPTSCSTPSIVTVAAGAPGARQQAPLPDREVALPEHPDHRPADDAGGADDGDGQGLIGHAWAWLRCGL